MSVHMLSSRLFQSTTVRGKKLKMACRLGRFYSIAAGVLSSDLFGLICILFSSGLGSC